jgi:hypothetical protein
MKQQQLHPRSRHALDESQVQRMYVNSLMRRHRQIEHRRTPIEMIDFNNSYRGVTVTGIPDLSGRLTKNQCC